MGGGGHLNITKRKQCKKKVNYITDKIIKIVLYIVIHLYFYYESKFYILYDIFLFTSFWNI